MHRGFPLLRGTALGVDPWRWVSLIWRSVPERCPTRETPGSSEPRGEMQRRLIGAVPPLHVRYHPFCTDFALTWREYCASPHQG